MTYNSKKNDVSNMVFNNVRSMVKRRTTPWVGTMTDLSEVLQNRVSESMMPGSASALRVVLNKVISRLRNSGISIKFSRSKDHERTRLVEFRNNIQK